MLIEKLSPEEVEIAGYLHDPIALAENLFTDEIKQLDSLQYFEEDKNFKVRIFQLPFFSYEYLIANNPKLTSQENFNLKIGAGQKYIFTGRGIGKSLCQIIDLCLDTIHNCFDWSIAVSSFDDIHVANLMEPYITTLKKHPFLKNFYNRAIRNPYKVETLPNRSVSGINMTLSGREAGSAWESHHVAKIILDEAQYETDQVIQKRSQAISEKGCIERLSGITSFTRQSPIGKIFFDIDKKNWLVNLPKTVSPFWNSKLKKEATDDYGDDSAPAYKIHIEAEVIENAIGLYDIDLLRRCYLDNIKRPIKHFDINKENYDFYKTRVIVEKLNYAKRVWLSADFGVTAPTEIIIIFEIEDKDTKEANYKYIYNLTLTGLIPDQQTEIFKWLIKELDVDYVSMDITELGGAQVLQDLNKVLPQDRLIGVKFNERLIVGYEKDDFGNLKLVDGKLVPIEAYVIDWAVEKTREIFYKQKINCLYDLKLDKQFSNMIAIRQANRLKYSTLLSNKEDHLHASFLVWSIARFLKAESEDSKPKRITWGIGTVGSV